MKETNPKAEQLFEEMDRQAAKMEQLRERAREMQQSG